MHHKKKSLKRVCESPPSLSKKPRRRGRPSVDWTLPRYRRLLRLYLNTPESSLPLEQILLLLKEDTFEPKKRNTQIQLQRLLSTAYEKRRPSDRDDMKARITYLRSHLKAESVVKQSPVEHSVDGLTHTDFSHALPASPVTNPTHPIQNHELSNFSIINTGQTSESNLLVGCSPQIASHSTASYAEANLSPEIALPKEAKDIAKVHKDRMSFVRSTLPARHTSSFLADVVSLFSGLSLRPSFQSSACESRRISSPSFSSPRTKSDKSEVLRSRFFRKKIDAFPQTQKLSAPRAREDPFFDQRSSVDHSILTTFCCSRLYQESPCIHKQLCHVIRHGLPNAAQGAQFFMQVTEVNMRDPMGNCLIHHAARWGASMDLLLGIARQSSFTRVTNYRSETFLHLLAPNTGSFLRGNELRCFTKLIDLIKPRLFNFCIIDDTGRSILRRLLLNPEFPWKAILILLEGVGSEVIRSWTFGDQSGKLAKDVQARTRHDRGQSFALALHTQHLIDGSSVQIAHRQNFDPGNLMCRTYTAVRGGNVLHRVIAMLNTKNKWIITRCPWVPWHRCEDDDAHEPLNFAIGLKAIINTPGYQTYVDEKESCTERTPLMTLLIEFGCGSLQDDELQADCVSVLLDHGASLDVCDSLGNTPVHYAAALGLSPALKVFRKHQIALRKRNEFGLTPKDAAMGSLVFEKASNNPRGVKGVARLYEAIAILSE